MGAVREKSAGSDVQQPPVTKSRLPGETDSFPPFRFFSCHFLAPKKQEVRAGASRRQISGVCLGSKWDCVQTLAVIFTSGKGGSAVCIDIEAKHDIFGTVFPQVGKRRE